MHCLKTDAERFLLGFSQTLDADMPDFLAARIREVRARAEVRLNFISGASSELPCASMDRYVVCGRRILLKTVHFN